LSQVGYFYGGDCEGYCLLACDSSVEALHDRGRRETAWRKHVVVYGEGRTEWNRPASISYAICLWSAKHKSFLCITAML